jgi:polar amino acid transport system permease protein
MHEWNWSWFFEYLFSPFLLVGAFTTLWLTAVSAMGGLLAGFIVAFAKQSRFALLRGMASFYVWFFRGTPLLVQLIIIFTGLPQIGIRLSVIASAILGLTLNEAAYLSEVIRGALQAVPVGQRNAAKSLGMTQRQAMAYVILPQAFRVMIPTLGNGVNGLLKTTSITSTISMEELLRRTQLLIQEHFLVLELFMVASIYYLIMTTAWDLVQVRLERRFGKGFGQQNPNLEQR